MNTSAKTTTADYKLRIGIASIAALVVIIGSAALLFP